MKVFTIDSLNQVLDAMYRTPLPPVENYFGDVVEKKDDPEFEGAPDWANYKATSSWGLTQWFEQEPFLAVDTPGWGVHGGKFESVPKVRWQDTLKKRRR